MVKIHESKGAVVMQPLTRRRCYRLEDLLAEITLKNPHAAMLDEGAESSGSSKSCEVRMAPATGAARVFKAAPGFFG